MAHRYKIVDPNQPIFVEYIENTANNWIEIPDVTSPSGSNVRIETVASANMVNHNSGDNGHLVGFYSGIGFGINAHGWTWASAGDETYTYTIPANSNQIYKVSIYRNSSGNRIIECNERTITYTTAYRAGDTLGVFQQAYYIQHGKTPRKAKIYSIKIYTSGTLTHHFCPCISRESGHINEPALYDVINKRYYYNQGTGTFLVGQPIIKTYKIIDTSLPVFVEYIENTSQNWIETDIRDGLDISIECKVGITTPIIGSLSWLVGCYAGIGFGVNNNYQIILPNVASSILAESGKKYKVRLFRNSSGNRCATINNQTITTDVNTNNYPVTIFGQRQYILAYRSYHPGKIYSVKIYRNNVLTNDLRPCLSRESGHINEPALYDVINKRYYYNQGTGTFRTGQPILNTRVIMR